jgi:tetratricopeptide (TPR) repeat protein
MNRPPFFILLILHFVALNSTAQIQRITPQSKQNSNVEIKGSQNNVIVIQGENIRNYNLNNPNDITLLIEHLKKIESFDREFDKVLKNISQLKNIIIDLSKDGVVNTKQLLDAFKKLAYENQQLIQENNRIKSKKNNSIINNYLDSANTFLEEYNNDGFQNTIEKVKKELFNQKAKINLDYSFACFQQAKYNFLFLKLKEALAQINEAILYNENEVTFFILKANIEQKLFKLRESIKTNNKALNLTINDTMKISIFHNIALSYYELSINDSAITYYKKAISLNQKLFDNEYQGNPGLYNDYANTLAQGGIYKEAISILNKTIKIDSTLYGPENQFAARSYNNLSRVYYDLNDIDNAFKYAKLAEGIYEKFWIDSDPEKAYIYNTLAILYEARLEYLESLRYHKKAQEIRELIYGKSHPITATTYNDIGVLYLFMGNYDTSITYLRRSIEINTSYFGEKHIYIAGSLANIGFNFNNLYQYDSSVYYHRKALKIYSELFPTDHPLIATCYFNLGSSLFGLGKYQEAINYQLLSLKIREKKFGSNNFICGTSYIQIGIIYDRMNQANLALDYYKKAEYVFEKSSNPSSKKYLSELYSLLILFYTKIDDLTNALIYRQKLEKSTK